MATWHADDWTWVTARRQRKKRKVLAGFARATGDGALTATIHDLAVLPELQGLGLGRKLLAKATTQVSAHCQIYASNTGFVVSRVWLQLHTPNYDAFEQESKPDGNAMLE